MKKIKISVPEETFDTLNTKYPADSNNVSNDSLTAGTKNIETSVKGVITKRKGGVVYSTLPNPPRDQYEAIFSDGVRHLLTVDNGNLRYTSGDGNENLVLAGLSANLNFEFATTQDKVYFGNGIQKKVYDRVTNYGGVTYTFPTQTVKNMGAIAPSSAPTVAIAAGGSVPIGNHTYKVTFVYYDSEESNGSVASTVATTTGGNQTVNLTVIPIGGYGVTQRKIYRDNNDNVYTFVGVINNNTATTFSDTIAAGLTPLPTDQGLPPDFTLISLFVDKLFVAGVSGDPYIIFYSDTGMPDVFPALNYITCNQEDPITGLVVYLDRLIVFNRRSMGQILGKTSDQFRYADIQSSVGCVDNRSIQIRVIDGVPVLVWLSDKGFYAYNGNSVVYISDVIEDQINSNIQQSVIQKNRISHSDYATFTSGTQSDGVNLEANQGTITTKGPYWDTVAHPGATYDEQTNPKKIFDTQDEWEDGTTQTNIVTDNTETVKVPTKFAPTLQSGTLSNLVISGTDLTIAEHENYAGASYASLSGLSSHQAGIPFCYKFAYRIKTHDRIAVLKQLQVAFYAEVNYNSLTQPSITVPFRVSLYGSIPYSGNLTKPGTLITSLGTYSTVFPNVSPQNYAGMSSATLVTSTALAASTEYYLVVEVHNFSGLTKCEFFPTGFNLSPDTYPSQVGNVGSRYLTSITNPEWLPITALYAKTGVTAATHSFTVCANLVSQTGQWVSGIQDTQATSLDFPTIDHTGSYPSGSFCSGPYTTSGTTAIEASDDPFMVTGVSLENINNLNGSQLLTLSNKQYWRIRITLNTTDDRDVPTAGTPVLKFNTQGVWESEVIDCTSDVSSYQSLTTTKVDPVGTSVVTEIATSAVNTGPWTYVSFGSHVVRQYVKLKLILNADTGDTLTPSVSALDFKWVVGNGTSSASFISPAIDTGTNPSGWDIFQASYNENGGTVQFQLRSATTSGGLTGATWYNVTNGEFPTNTLPTLQWIQWRALLQANPDQIPTVDSVTIGWFVGTDIQSIRCASIFYDKNYYVSLAEFEQDKNNLMYVLDFTGKWRLFKDVNAATLSYFFNNPYYGDGSNGKIARFLEGTADQGSPIELDVRTKAFDGSTQWTDNEDKVKVLDHVIVSVTNTGASFDCHYSIDDGMTFNPLYDTSGNNSWSTITDGREVKKYLRPRYTTSIPQGRTIMLKVHNNDTKEVQLKSLKVEAFTREQPPIITG